MKYLRRTICSAVFFMAANLVLLPKALYPWPQFCLLGSLLLNIIPSLANRRLLRRRHRVCANGCELLIYFFLSTTAAILYTLIQFPSLLQDWWPALAYHIICCVLVEGLLFWNGIIRVYLTSCQLGLKWRLIGILCGWIPIANLVVLSRIIRIASFECHFENEKLLLNEKRKSEEICRTKYPILLVHGVFFRDFRYLNYWGRIPKELEANGACIYYGNHQSAASVADSGAELAKRIQEILEKTGCEKVNIIAHSKGGLDCRYLVSRLKMADSVASLTTINTPHRGCIFADYLLNIIPQAVKDQVAKGYNTALQKLGDENPDFLAAVNDLTASACEAFNRETPDMPETYYQSVGSRLNKATSGRFPLNFTHDLVKHFDGPNDGLVSEDAFSWGQDYTFLSTKGKRGISHGDMVDLNRENIPGFDVREFYVKLVQGLKEKGF